MFVLVCMIRPASASSQVSPCFTSDYCIGMSICQPRDAQDAIEIVCFDVIRFDFRFVEFE